MIRNSPDEAVARMRTANPFSAEELRETIDQRALMRAMRRAILAGSAPVSPIPTGDRAAMDVGAADGSGRVGFLRGRHIASVGFGLACAAAVAILIVLGGGSVDSVKEGGRPTYAAAAVEVAEANPRLLVTAPGWSIAHAHSFEAESGELSFRDAAYPPTRPHSSNLTMYWSPASGYRDVLRGSRRKATVRRQTVLGRSAITFRYDGQPDFITVLPPQGNVFVTFSAALPAVEYETVLSSLRAVGVERWLAAMPAEVVGPTAESGVVAGMLHGLPLPPGFDVSSLGTEGELTDRYTLGKAVANAIVCGWLESWDAATRSDETAATEEAIEAMSGARHWPVLLRMVREKGFQGAVLPADGNGWPSNIVAAGREIAAGHLRRRPAVKTIRDKDDNVLGVQTPRNAAPASVLGCRLGG